MALPIASALPTMDAILSRYRSLAVLVTVILAQLVLVAYQRKSDNDMASVRVWAVTAVTPVARVLESLRRNSFGFFQNYFVLVDLREENKKLKDDLGKFKLENQFLKNELQMADRVQALSKFQAKTPSRTVGARIIGTGTGTNSKMVLVDRGTSSGVERGMAVITQDGIVGKVVASYPIASQVLLITDTSFRAGVISQKGRVHGTVKGIGQSRVMVDYIQNEDKVEVDEEFFTSGEDRVFPKGLAVGKAEIVRPGTSFKEVQFVPSGLQSVLEEVLIVIEGVHQRIPDFLPGLQNPVVLLTPLPPGLNEKPRPQEEIINSMKTDADRLRERYTGIGSKRSVVGQPAPDYNAEPPPPKPITPGTPNPSAAPVNPNPTPQGGAVPKR